MSKLVARIGFDLGLSELCCLTRSRPEFLTQLETLRLRTRREFLGSHTGSLLFASPRHPVWSLPITANIRPATICAISTGVFTRAPTGSTSRCSAKRSDLFAYVFIDCKRIYGVSVARREIPAGDARSTGAGLRHLGQSRSRQAAFTAEREPAPRHRAFYRGRRRMADCIEFATSAVPAGPMVLWPHRSASIFNACAGRGKAILISDFLTPAAAYQQGLNLLRGFNLEHRRHSNIVA